MQNLIGIACYSKDCDKSGNNFMPSLFLIVKFIWKVVSSLAKSISLLYDCILNVHWFTDASFFTYILMCFTLFLCLVSFLIITK